MNDIEKQILKEYEDSSVLTLLSSLNVNMLMFLFNNWCKDHATTGEFDVSSEKELKERFFEQFCRGMSKFSQENLENVNKVLNDPKLKFNDIIFERHTNLSTEDYQDRYNNAVKKVKEIFMTSPEQGNNTQQEDE